MSHTRITPLLLADPGQNREEIAYPASVPAVITPMSFDVDSTVSAAAEDARAAITRFDAELSSLAGGDHEFAPMASVLLRTESMSSSQIENITAGARTLALAELGLTGFGSNAKQVVANVDAIKRALTVADDVSLETILSIHEALMRDQPHIGPGAFREEQVWIGGRDSYPHGADFVPPHHSRIRSTIDDLCAFTERSDLPLVAQVAIAHAQFETIHPFNDGNGRTGRAPVHAMLKKGARPHSPRCLCPQVCSATPRPTSTPSPPTVKATRTPSLPGSTTPRLPRSATGGLLRPTSVTSTSAGIPT